MRFVPSMVAAVANNAYKVTEGDDVGKIASGLVGDPDRYHELVGANLHKSLIDHEDLEHRIFASLHTGERLNVPASWFDHSTGAVGDAAADQLAALAGTLGAVITAMVTANNIPPVQSNIPSVAGVLAQWWQYLNLPPNNTWIPTGEQGFPPIGIDPNVLINWFGANGETLGKIRTDAFAAIVAAADRYWQAAQAIPYMPWDKVPWKWLAEGGWQKLATAFANNPAALMDLANIAIDLAKGISKPNMPWLQRMGSTGALPLGRMTLLPTQPPKFVGTDWTQPPYSVLIEWAKQNIDPSKISWDVIKWVSDNASKVSNAASRLAEISADIGCFSSAYGDPVENFKKWFLAPTYEAGWCKKLPACKTCTQLGASCGKVENGCGQIMDCGSCPEGQTCQGGKCVPVGDEKSGKPSKTPWGWIAAGSALAIFAGAMVFTSKKSEPASNPVHRGWGRVSFTGSKYLATRLGDGKNGDDTLIGRYDTENEAVAALERIYTRHGRNYTIQAGAYRGGGQRKEGEVIAQG